MSLVECAGWIVLASALGPRLTDPPPSHWSLWSEHLDPSASWVCVLSVPPELSIYFKPSDICFCLHHVQLSVHTCHEGNDLPRTKPLVNTAGCLWCHLAQWFSKWGLHFLEILPLFSLEYLNSFIYLLEILQLFLEKLKLLATLPLLEFFKNLFNLEFLPLLNLCFL